MSQSTDEQHCANLESSGTNTPTTVSHDHPTTISLTERFSPDEQNQSNATPQVGHHHHVTPSTLVLAARLHEYRNENRQLRQALMVQQNSGTVGRGTLAVEERNGSPPVEAVAEESSVVPTQPKTVVTSAEEWKSRYEAAVDKKKNLVIVERDAWKSSFHALKGFCTDEEGADGLRAGGAAGAEIAQARDLDLPRVGDVVTAQEMAEAGIGEEETAEMNSGTREDCFMESVSDGEAETTTPDNFQTQLTESLHEINNLRTDRDSVSADYLRLDAAHESLRAAFDAADAERRELQVRLAESEWKRIVLAQGLQRANEVAVRKREREGEKTAAGGMDVGPVKADKAKATIKSAAKSDAASYQSTGPRNDVTLLLHLQQHISPSLPKINLDIRKSGENFFASLKQTHHISDYDDAMFICYCQSPINITTHHPRVPKNGKRGFSHLASAGKDKGKVPYSWRLWASHASCCPYLKEPSAYRDEPSSGVPHGV